MPLLGLVECERCEELFLWLRLRRLGLPLLLLRLCVVAVWAIAKLLMLIKMAIRIALILMPL